MHLARVEPLVATEPPELRQRYWSRLRRRQIGGSNIDSAAIHRQSVRHGSMSHSLTSRAASPALFLSVDGALLERAPTPTTVSVPASLTELLYQLWLRLDGALALVSGRPIDDLDRMFRPYRFPAIGVLGSEYRDGIDNVTRLDVDSYLISKLHDKASSLATEFPDVLIEYRSHGVAFHYGLEPAVIALLLKRVTQLWRRLGTEFALHQGESSLEIHPAMDTQGIAIREMMKDPVFQGRQPVLVGGALADEGAFIAINSIGGVSISIETPRRTCAQHLIVGRKALLEMLYGICDEPSSPVHEFSRAFRFR